MTRLFSPWLGLLVGAISLSTVAALLDFVAFLGLQQCQTSWINVVSGNLPLEAYLVPVGGSPRLIAHVRSSDGFRNETITTPYTMTLQANVSYIVMLAAVNGEVLTTPLTRVHPSRDASCLVDNDPSEVTPEFTFAITGDTKTCSNNFRLAWDDNLDSSPYWATLIPLNGGGYRSVELDLPGPPATTMPGLVNVVPGTIFMIMLNNRNGYGRGGTSDAYLALNGSNWCTVRNFSALVDVPVSPITVLPQTATFTTTILPGTRSASSTTLSVTPGVNDDSLANVTGEREPNIAAIAGGAAGGFAALLAGTLIIVCCRRRRARKQESERAEHDFGINGGTQAFENKLEPYQSSAMGSESASGANHRATTRWPSLGGMQSAMAGHEIAPAPSAFSDPTYVYDTAPLQVAHAAESRPDPARSAAPLEKQASLIVPVLRADSDQYVEDDNDQPPSILQHIDGGYPDTRPLRGRTVELPPVYDGAKRE